MQFLAATTREQVPAAAAAEAAFPPHEPALLLTHDGWLVGDLLDVDGRVSDALGQRETICLATLDGYRELERDEVLVVVPPATASRPEQHVAKRRLPVTVDVAGLVSISGECHALPGATVWDVWQRSCSGFAALTDALVEFPDGTTETADVVLVSRHAAATGLRAVARANR